MANNKLFSVMGSRDPAEGDTAVAFLNEEDEPDGYRQNRAVEVRQRLEHREDLSLESACEYAYRSCAR
jgi:hypothetical protein